jgi:hypothetical protein
MKMPKSSNELADDFVRTAAFLKRELEGRNATVAYMAANKDNRTIYIFDTNVIITKCAPWITGPFGSDENSGWGVIFSDPAADSHDEKIRTQLDKKAESIVSILASYALRRNRDLDQAPIFQLPSHSSETNNVFRAVRRQVETFDNIDIRRTQSRESFELSRALALVKHRLSQGDGIEDVRALIDSILNWLVYDGKPTSRRALVLREWDSYYNLEAEFGGIFPIDTARMFFPRHSDVSRACAVVQAAARSYEEEDIFVRLSNYWKSQLDRRSKRNTQADAEALANLFLINARLAETNWSCVFVTGDRALTRIAYSNIPTQLVPEKHRSLASEFSLRCVRHLWAYTADALIEPEKHRVFTDLFNGLLAHWSKTLTFDNRTLEDLVDHQIRRPGRHIQEDNLERVLNEWENLTTKSIGQHAFEEYQKHEPLRLALLVALKRLMPKGGLSDLRGLLREEVDRARDRAVLSMSDLGLDVIIQADSLGRRNPPELIFDSLKNTNGILQRLSIAEGYSDARSFEYDLAKIADDCYDSSSDGDDRQQSYLKFIVLGAAFVSAEKWLIALNHARRAIAIISRSARLSSPIPVRVPDSNTGAVGTYMSGREAYFLAAVAQRMLAGSDSEFTEAHAYLDQAANALKEDHGHRTAANITMARFDGERLAIALGRYYLARSTEPTNYRDELVGKIYDAAAKGVALFDEWLRNPARKTLRGVTAVNLSVNLIQTYVIHQFRSLNRLDEGMPCPVTVDVVSHALESISRLTNYAQKSPDAINATRLIRAYALVGEILITERPATISKLYARLRKQLDPGDDLLVTRYDRWRYSALLDFIERWVALALRNSETGRS